jgi:hypothetical protein
MGGRRGLSPAPALVRAGLAPKGKEIIMERIYLEGDLQGIAQSEYVSPDQIIDSLLYDLQQVAKEFEFTARVDDTYFVNEVRTEGGTK